MLARLKAFELFLYHHALRICAAWGYDYYDLGHRLMSVPLWQWVFASGVFEFSLASYRGGGYYRHLWCWASAAFGRFPFHTGFVLRVIVSFPMTDLVIVVFMLLRMLRPHFYAAYNDYY
ncbi:hypothetical protein FOA52_015396 [Chlamydomonas sp. UWO 241]|nr:hypothetical protein FOA52_015396 [Chlamydomonas sp. UWO 241]